VDTHYNITVYGRVQGVGYRYSALSMARYLNVKGIVRNKYDGSVYIEAEGSTEQLDDFVKWCKQGPEHANVTEVLVTISENKGYSSFDVTA
jgi:acylphosphatase